MGKSVSAGLLDRLRLAGRAICLFSLFALLVSGCGEKVQMKKVDLMGGVAKSDQDKIRGYLDAAGIKGVIVSIQEDEAAWIVDVGAPPPKPGQKPIPVAPTAYQVDKASGKVTGGPEAGAM